MGLPSSRFGPLVVGCMGYGGVCDLRRSTHLMCHIVCPVLSTPRIGVDVYLGGLGFSELKFSLYLFEIMLCVVSLDEFGQGFCKWWVCSFMPIYVVELV